MTEKEEKNSSGGVSRREFLKDAGLLVSGTAIGSSILLAACGDGETVTEMATKTVTGAGSTATKTVTTTEQVGGATVTDTVTESRYICPVDGMEFDTLDELKEHYAEVHADGDSSALTVLNINGKEYSAEIEDYWTLQYLLCELGLTGSAKTFCDHGACGSCTVNIDHRPVLSCMTLAIECEGKSIETIEGIAEANHPVIEAYIKNDVAQCGYCIPGFITTAKALLDKNPDPSTDEIKEALGGNLCRCGSYVNHIPAIKQAAQTLKGGS